MRVAFILLLATALISRVDENAAGRWEGTVQIPGRPLEVIVDLAAKSDKGEWQGSITIPGLGIKGAPLSDIALNGDNVAFSIKSALAEQRTGLAKFSGRFGGDGEISRQFRAGGKHCVICAGENWSTAGGNCAAQHRDREGDRG